MLTDIDAITWNDPKSISFQSAEKLFPSSCTLISGPMNLIRTTCSYETIQTFNLPQSWFMKDWLSLALIFK